jgi:hypothetical protein
MSATRKRNTRVYRACCAGIVRHLKSCLDKEKQKEKLHVGISRVFKGIQCYTNLSQSTIQHLLHDDDIPEEGKPETRQSRARMTEEDEYKIRPTVIALWFVKRLQ